MALNAYTIYGDPLVEQTQLKDPRTRSEDDFMIMEQTAQLTNQAFRGSTFVPAQRTYDELGRPLSSEITKETHKHPNSSGNSVGDWYTSLQRTQSVTLQPASTRDKGKAIKKGHIHSDTQPLQATPSVSATQHHPRKPDWFRSSSSQAAIERATLPSLAEMLRRDPPDSQNPLEPPVYYGIGPTNKGYEMLTKGGWLEGRPLGPQNHDIRAKKSKQPIEKPVTPTHTENLAFLSGEMPTLVVPGRFPGDVKTIHLRRGDSTDEEDDDKGDSDGPENERDTMFNQATTSTSRASSPSSSSSEVSKGDLATDRDQSHNRGQRSNRPLLTPIAVALKNDRKGLGLSKTRRLVTHSSLALHEHIQKGKLSRKNQMSEMRRLERDAKKGQYGRGKRAYAKMAKEDAAKRQRLMEYMNT
ncbi:hypothetical protein CPB86DRAFT_787243 [Serendipita vermifera]|nr:hypothetical protein CPB86DRAFT_787243 [Serendipita vermifera]